MDMNGSIACAASPNRSSVLLGELQVSAHSISATGHLDVFVTMLKISVKLLALAIISQANSKQALTLDPIL